MDNPRLKEKFIDEFAAVMAKAGVPTEAGQMFGWLLACEPPCQTVDEIASALKLDRNLVGQMGKLLVSYGVVDSVSLPDKECLTMKPLSEMMQQRLGIVDDLVQALDKGIELTQDNPEQQGRIKEFRDLYAEIGKEMPRLVERWKAGKSNRSEGVPLE